MCYATLACVTDYDTWHASHGTVTVDMVIRNLKRNVGNAKRIVASVAASLPPRDCTCKDALATAIITPMDIVPEQAKRDLEPILSRVSTAVTA